MSHIECSGVPFGIEAKNAKAILMITKDLQSTYSPLPCSFSTGTNTGTTPPNAVHLRHVRGFRGRSASLLGQASSGILSISVPERNLTRPCPSVGVVPVFVPSSISCWT
jgi:hypothetical protein